MTKVELISDVQTFLDYLTSDEINVLDANFVSDEVIEIHYENNENFVTPNSKTNVVIAAFTTAYARLKLYGVLDELQERVLYYDTDSVIFVSKPGEPEPPIGPYLGQLTDELKEGHINNLHFGRTEELLLSDQFQQSGDENTRYHVELHRKAKSEL